MTHVYAAVLVRVHRATLAHDETTKRPVAVADRELATSGIVNFIQPADGDFFA